MRTRNFIRQIALVIPFLVIFYFPIAASIYNRLVKAPIDWNQGFTGLIEVGGKPAPNLNIQKWWKGVFQKSLSDWWGNYCPARAFFLRLFDQVDYSVFRSSYMLQNALVIGPDGQLDELRYILSACHQESFPLPDYVPHLMEKLEHLRAQLAKQGKSLLIVITPGKATTYPETIPSRFWGYDSSRSRAYDDLTAALKHSDFAFVDGAKIIHEYAEKSPYPLFLRGGVHWDSYATALLLPPIVEKISQLTNKPLPVPTVVKVNMTNAAQSQNIQDTDLAELLNVFRPSLDYDCPDLVMNYRTSPPGQAPHVILAGGSFAWGLLGLLQGPQEDGRPRMAFANYAEHFFMESGDHPISRKLYENELARSDLVLLEINEILPSKTIYGLLPIVDEVKPIPVSSRFDISFAEGGIRARVPC